MMCSWCVGVIIYVCVCVCVVSKSQLKWGEEERSPALQDILHQINELNELWFTAQQEYIGRYIGIMVQWYNGIMVHWYNGIMVHWYKLYNVMLYFIVALKEYKNAFESILESEKKLDQARKSLVSIVERNAK